MHLHLSVHPLSTLDPHLQSCWQTFDASGKVVNSGTHKPDDQSNRQKMEIWSTIPHNDSSSGPLVMQLSCMTEKGIVSWRNTFKVSSFVRNQTFLPSFTPSRALALSYKITTNRSSTDIEDFTSC